MRPAALLVLLALPAILAQINRVTYVDQNTNTGNFLFRGGTPDDITGYQFDYNGLVSALQAAAKTAGVTLPPTFLITDIDLMHFDQPIDSDMDSIESKSEFNFFLQNPSKGSYVFFHSTGTKTNATDTGMTTDLRNYLAPNLPNWLEENIPQRMSMIRQWMDAKYSIPTVFYGHCDCGCDRTGEFFGSYYMRWLNMTWQATNDLNTKIINGRSMCCQNYLAMQWYCLYLNAVQGYKLDCLTNQPCTQCGSEF
jgi:hypothetical protein